MKLNKYIKWQILKWLPLFLVFFVVSSSSIWLDFLGRSYVVYNDYPEYLQYFDASLMEVVLIFFAIACVMPFFVFNYRYSKTGADTYNALPIKKNVFRNTRILIGGVYIAAVFTVVFWITFLLVLFRYSTININSYGPQCHKVDINFAMFVPAYLYILIATLGTYLFNCTLASLGNNFIGSSIYMLSGEIALIFLFVVVTSYFHELVDNYNNVFYESYMGLGADVIFSDQVLEKLIENKELGTTNINITFVIISILIKYGIGSISFIVSEPSGEYFGKPGARINYHKAIIYVALGVVLVAFASTFKYTSIGSFIGYIMLGATCYLTLVIFNRSFKISFFEIITLVSIFGGFTILATMMSLS